MSRKIATVLCASALTSSLLGISAVANAAELPVKAPPAPAAPPPFSWTGFYIGGNLGAGWSERTVSDTLFGLDVTNQGNGATFIGGGQVGVNYQINNVVLGVEADFDWASNNNNTNGGVVIHGDTFQVTSNNTWITTVAGRIGYAAWDRFLLYVKGGGGWIGNSGFTVTNVTTGTSVTGSNNNTDSGWLVGGGGEWAFADNWSVRLEYDFLGLGDRTVIVPAAVPVVGGDIFTLHDRNVQMVTVGLNYRFNWGNWNNNAVATRY